MDQRAPHSSHENDPAPPPLPPPLPGQPPSATPGSATPPITPDSWSRPANESSQALRPIPISHEIDPLNILRTAAERSEMRDGHQSDTELLAKAAPPWAVSFVWHMVLLIVLGLLFLPGRTRETFELEAVFADTVGEQLDEVVSMSTPEIPDVEESIVMEKEWQPVDDPLASLPMIDLVTEPDLSTATFSAPTIGVALHGRDAGMKRALLKAYGGTAETEAAVKNGLAWLKRRQEKRGSWSLVGPYSDGGGTQNRIAATAMALLAFQGAGNTTEQGPYRKEVLSAWKFMKLQQDGQGAFFKRVGASNHRFYTHALATIAVCELFAMTKDESLRQPAQDAVDYLVETQDSLGGWRYHPANGSDLSVTGWVVMALQSARMAGIEVPSPVFEKIAKFLDRVEDQYGAQYSYLRRDAPTKSMSAEGLLCRQYLGWAQNRPALQAGADYLLDNPIEWRDPNLYYWYYATQVLHHMEGDHWNRWNRVMRVAIPKEQEKVGKEKGSWYNEDDRFSAYGGRLYSTCLCIYMLEVYYRHLPIYANIYAE